MSEPTSVDILQGQILAVAAHLSSACRHCQALFGDWRGLILSQTRRTVNVADFLATLNREPASAAPIDDCAICFGLFRQCTAPSFLEEVGQSARAFDPFPGTFEVLVNDVPASLQLRLMRLYVVCTKISDKMPTPLDVRSGARAVCQALIAEATAERPSHGRYDPAIEVRITLAFDYSGAHADLRVLSDLPAEAGPARIPQTDPRKVNHPYAVLQPGILVSALTRYKVPTPAMPPASPEADVPVDGANPTDAPADGGDATIPAVDSAGAGASTGAADVPPTPATEPGISFTWLEYGLRMHAGQRPPFSGADLSVVPDLPRPGSPLRMTCAFTSPSLYIAGRYTKHSREVSQSIWVIGGRIDQLADEDSGPASAGSGGAGPTRKTALSVEEALAKPLSALTGAGGAVFVGSGREDADVRMLGQGRPFYVELQNPRHRPGPASLAALGAAISRLAGPEAEAFGRALRQRPDSATDPDLIAGLPAACVGSAGGQPVRLHREQLVSLTLEQTNPIRVPDAAAEAEKTKTYRAVVRVRADVLARNGLLSSQSEDFQARRQAGPAATTATTSPVDSADAAERLMQEDLARVEPALADLIRRVADTRDLALNQDTPLRVLHRRAPMTRVRHIHAMQLRPIWHQPLDSGARYFELFLTTQSGTYIKEFVHGDLGRTSPSFGSQFLGINPAGPFWPASANHTTESPVDIVALDVFEVELAWPPTEEATPDPGLGEPPSKRPRVEAAAGPASC
ncbi:hypothetical protein H696_04633 [Fonticula alba]|uniref:tRNA pseudouridine(55) synthase n=1 Tax=Fonticula alba TaxID=691883 RepID=A0A058Z502_FONAL|nr:hypothetical protein H696_04633 [Fonticula alba]KCV69216.1 hypothetical protein H696_04633 [Fonticula alba]|eukprot:XP_009496787.1 hypothetical protein H696_04633 [Fonticula alba]